jgi:Predicted periplasmic or secreted lipoprotein
MKNLLTFIAIITFALALSSCKGKSDADLQTEITSVLATNPDFSGIVVDVQNGVATLSGEVSNPASQVAAEEALKDIKGIKSVVNNTTVAPPPAPVQITADDPLTTAVQDAIKDHPGVSATVNDGVVTLTGEVQKDELKVLMQKINATRPKKVDNTGLTIK